MEFQKHGVATALIPRIQVSHEPNNLIDTGTVLNN